VAEGFTCDVDYLDRFACEGLDFYGEHESKRYCVLHYPGEEKNKEDFLKVKKSKLDRQDYIFRGTVFPKGTSDFEGFEFDADANFAGANFAGAIFLGAAQFSEAKFSCGGPTSQEHSSAVRRQTSQEPSSAVQRHPSTTQPLRKRCTFAKPPLRGELSSREAK
jgi:hypothetical protein